MYKVSVVVPMYNTEEYLTESINSLLNQTLEEFEIICVNDGSTDNTLTMINNMAKKDSRIKIFNKPNGGCGSARNYGIDHVSGEYIYFFDPDDYLAKDSLEKFYNNASCNNSDMVLSKIAWYWEGETVRFDKPGFNLDEVFQDVDFNDFTFNYKDIKDYVLNSYFAPWTKLYKTSYIKRYNFRFEENIAYDDVPFHIETVLKAEKISFIPEAFCYYRVTNDSSVNNTSTNSADIIRICDIIEEFLKNNGFFPEFETEFLNFKITQLLLYIITSNSEFYYKFVKYEFMKMNIANVNLPDELIEEYNMVIESKDYSEYRLNKKEKPLPDTVKELSDKVSMLENKNNVLENDIKILKRDLSKLENENEKNLKELRKAKKINEDIFSSKSWKITKPLRMIIHLFKNKKE